MTNKMRKATIAALFWNLGNEEMGSNRFRRPQKEPPEGSVIGKFSLEEDKLRKGLAENPIQNLLSRFSLLLSVGQCPNLSKTEGLVGGRSV